MNNDYSAKTDNRRVNQWDADDYDKDVGFVTEYGESIVELLDPGESQRILDIGCGTGHLTADIADEVGSEGTVVGIDAASDMIDSACDSYPSLKFKHADARKLSSIDFDVENFDAVFSNAALHWIPRDNQAIVASGVANLLAPEGQFVAELGGVGNVDTIVSAVRAELRERGYDRDHPWYFPSVGEHANMLESEGIEVQYARLFDRPTELNGESGLRDWLSIFADSMFAGLDDGERTAVITAVEDRLREPLYDPETKTWIADYRRLRFVAELA